MCSELPLWMFPNNSDETYSCLFRTFQWGACMAAPGVWLHEQCHLESQRVSAAVRASAVSAEATALKGVFTFLVFVASDLFYVWCQLKSSSLHTSVQEPPGVGA